ncbi:MAG: hypothetical protein ACI4DO_06630 [Roseburia sp.]
MNKENSKKNKNIFQDGPIEKASLIFLDSKGKSKLVLPVQFNPTEYSINRNLDYKENTGIGQESHPNHMQPGKGKLAELSVSIRVDATTTLKEFALPKKLEPYISDDGGLTKLCQMFSMLTKYKHEEHMPEQLIFSWGKLQFQGNVTGVNIQNQLFNKQGNPVKIKVDLTITGEEKEILKEIKANPNESPDRTKYRSVGQKDELWMLAYDEYDDSSAWKEIARENGILNPRKVDYTKSLKVPSL